MANPRIVARVAGRIQERVAYCLQFEMRDPRASFVTVTRVELSSDLKHAKVFYSTLETGGARSRVQHMLDDATGFVRSKIARVLDTREVPGLRWIHDESLERAAELDLLIRQARERDEAIRGPSNAEDDEDDEDADDADDAESSAAQDEAAS